MSQTLPHSNYLRTAVETASPVRRVVMLYDGAIRFLSQSLPAMRSNNYEQQGKCIDKSQAIIAHLRSSLDRAVAGDMGDALDSVYLSLYDMLTAANIYDSPDRVERAIEVLRELREAWVEVEHQCQVQKSVGRNYRERIAA